jgi:hypothetical protein
VGAEIVKHAASSWAEHRGFSVAKSGDLIDRRLSVAPMMDWTDDP